jgi:hypothetical protein
MGEVNVSELIAASGAVIGGFWAVGKMLIASFLARQSERDVQQDKAREEARQAMGQRLDGLEKLLRDQTEGQRHLEREVAALKVRIAEDYVRREDFVRVMSSYEAKVDNLALRIENAVLKGRGND